MLSEMNSILHAKSFRERNLQVKWSEGSICPAKAPLLQLLLNIPHLRRTNKQEVSKLHFKQFGYTKWTTGGSFNSHILSRSLFLSPVFRLSLFNFCLLFEPLNISNITFCSCIFFKQQGKICRKIKLIFLKSQTFYW